MSVRDVPRALVASSVVLIVLTYTLDTAFCNCGQLENYRHSETRVWSMRCASLPQREAADGHPAFPLSSGVCGGSRCARIPGEPSRAVTVVVACLDVRSSRACRVCARQIVAHAHWRHMRRSCLIGQDLL